MGNRRTRASWGLRHLRYEQVGYALAKFFDQLLLIQLPTTGTVRATISGVMITMNHSYAPDRTRGHRLGRSGVFLFAHLANNIVYLAIVAEAPYDLLCARHFVGPESYPFI